MLSYLSSSTSSEAALPRPHLVPFCLPVPSPVMDSNDEVLIQWLINVLSLEHLLVMIHPAQMMMMIYIFTNHLLADRGNEILIPRLAYHPAVVCGSEDYSAPYASLSFLLHLSFLCSSIVSPEG
jgi:hypothetical protein